MFDDIAKLHSGYKTLFWWSRHIFFPHTLRATLKHFHHGAAEKNLSLAFNVYHACFLLSDNQRRKYPFIAEFWQNSFTEICAVLNQHNLFTAQNFALIIEFVPLVLMQQTFPNPKLPAYIVAKQFQLFQKDAKIFKQAWTMMQRYNLLADYHRLPNLLEHPNVDHILAIFQRIDLLEPRMVWTDPAVAEALFNRLLPLTQAACVHVLALLDTFTPQLTPALLTGIIINPSYLATEVATFLITTLHGSIDQQIAINCLVHAALHPQHYAPLLSMAHQFGVLNNRTLPVIFFIQDPATVMQEQTLLLAKLPANLHRIFLALASEPNAMNLGIFENFLDRAENIKALDEETLRLIFSCPAPNSAISTFNLCDEFIQLTPEQFRSILKHPKTIKKAIPIVRTAGLDVALSKTVFQHMFADSTHIMEYTQLMMVAHRIGALNETRIPLIFQCQQPTLIQHNLENWRARFGDVFMQEHFEAFFTNIDASNKFHNMWFLHTVEPSVLQQQFLRIDFPALVYGLEILSTNELRDFAITNIFNSPVPVEFIHVIKFLYASSNEHWIIGQLLKDINRCQKPMLMAKIWCELQKIYNQKDSDVSNTLHLITDATNLEALLGALQLANSSRFNRKHVEHIVKSTDPLCFVKCYNLINMNGDLLRTESVYGLNALAIRANEALLELCNALSKTVGVFLNLRALVCIENPTLCKNAFLKMPQTELTFKSLLTHQKILLNEKMAIIWTHPFSIKEEQMTHIDHICNSTQTESEKIDGILDYLRQTVFHRQLPTHAAFFPSVVPPTPLPSAPMLSSYQLRNC